MKARVPLDVDMEDKLLYGLTPVRLAYVVVALLAAFATWSSRAAPSPVRAVACLVLVGLGAAIAWGHWRGRPVDGWLTDIGTFVTRAYRVRWDREWLNRFTNRFGRIPKTEKPPASVAILVVGRQPGAGASTVAVELAASLAAKGDAVELCCGESAQGLSPTASVGSQLDSVDAGALVALGAPFRWSIREAQAAQVRSERSDLLVSVAAVDAGRMCYLDSGEGHYVAAFIPEDDCVRQAKALNEATVVAFPHAVASRAFRELAEVVIGAR